MMQPLAPQQQTRFVDVKPGSKVRYTHNAGTQPPFEAFVLESKKDWGAAAIPAHIFRRDGGVEPELMPADGTWRVEVLVDSQILALAAPSANVVHGTRRAIEVTAIQFKGGFDSAAEMIQFAAGKANTSWRAASAEGLEAVVIQKADGIQLVTPGDYLVLDNEVASVYSATDFSNTFDVDA